MSTALVVFAIFLTLKLVKVLDWSWWWITSPLWISALLGFALGITVGLIGVFA